MSFPAEPLDPVNRLIQLERYRTPLGTEHWCKVLSPDFPAAAYWLFHEARILQALRPDSPHFPRLISVDLDHRAIVTEASGYPLTQWLRVSTGDFEHPFQRSSELIRLILASLQVLQALTKQGVTHGGLRPDVMILGQNARGELDYDNLRLIDFSAAYTLHDRIEKPLFINLDSQDSLYLSPVVREAVQKDWNSFGRICDEPDAKCWESLSDRAQHLYDTILIPNLAINGHDWRTDLYSLGYWFRQISLHRLEYFKVTHQDQLPALIKKMQKPVLHGGFSSLEACIKAFEGLELSTETFSIAEPPAAHPVVTMHPMPKVREISHEIVDHAFDADNASPTNEASGAPRAVNRLLARRPGVFAACGGLLLAAGMGAVWLGERFSHSAEHLTQAEIFSRQVNSSGSMAHNVDIKLETRRSNLAIQPDITRPIKTIPDTTNDFDGATTEAVREAAEGGNPAAQTQLGLRYRHGQGVAENNAEAVSWYRRAANQNFADAQAYLGFMYMTGRGVSRDDEAAARWSKLAAEAGSSTGQYNLALLYLAGRGVPKSTPEGYRWLKRAAEHDKSAQIRLDELKAHLSEDDLSKAKPD